MTAASILYLFLLFFGLRKKKDGDGLSRRDTEALRGFFSLYILLVHAPDAYSYLNGAYRTSFEPFVYQGHLAVGVFFALSGFGLALSARWGLAGFIRKRVRAVLLPYVLANLVFFAFFQISGRAVTPAGMFLSCFSGDPELTYSWYIVTQCLFYAFFYIIFRGFEKMKTRLLVLFLTILCYMLFFPAVGWPYVTARGALAFVFGVYAGTEGLRLTGGGVPRPAEGKTPVEGAAPAEGKIPAGGMDPVEGSFPDPDRRAAKKRLFRTGSAFFISYILYLAFPFLKEHPVLDFSSVLFAASLFLSARFFTLDSRLFRFLGSISLEIYLYQGLAFAAVKRIMERLGTNRESVYVLCSILLAVGAALFFHFLYAGVLWLVDKSAIFSKAGR
ncbi:MAG: acyltransferase [Lachnospiraceae bacterium]|nr:acyltransferase [Lachnospiraceae bacterium]